jgi:hypothetical protein
MRSNLRGSQLGLNGCRPISTASIMANHCRSSIGRKPATITSLIFHSILMDENGLNAKVGQSIPNLISCGLSTNGAIPSLRTRSRFDRVAPSAGRTRLRRDRRRCQRRQCRRLAGQFPKRRLLVFRQLAGGGDDWPAVSVRALPSSGFSTRKFRRAVRLLEGDVLAPARAVVSKSALETFPDPPPAHARPPKERRAKAGPVRPFGEPSRSSAVLSVQSGSRYRRNATPSAQRIIPLAPLPRQRVPPLPRSGPCSRAAASTAVRAGPCAHRSIRGQP